MEIINNIQAEHIKNHMRNQLICKSQMVHSHCIQNSADLQNDMPKSFFWNRLTSIFVCFCKWKKNVFLYFWNWLNDKKSIINKIYQLILLQNHLYKDLLCFWNFAMLSSSILKISTKEIDIRSNIIIGQYNIEIVKEKT